MFSNFFKLKLKKLPKLLTPENITEENVRLIELDGTSKIVSKEEAFSISKERDLDLMIVNSSIKPIVIKLVNYQAFVQEQQKLEYKSSKREKNKGNKMKSIALKLKIDQHDLEWKMKKMKEWLLGGDRVQLIIKTPFDTTEVKSPVADNLLNRIKELLKDEGKTIEPLKGVNKTQYTCIFSPITKKSNDKSEEKSY
ncbi:translation initiation factor IF-3 [Mycoplasma parvum]|uniref:translation initiation factor IF-3 n=1 Tax=Mycoplasma parvum TaxID=984991 RepID=UPI0038B25E7E